ncbi:MAG: hypothetical protein M0Z50_10630 [Planctomycetia bacterium]|nr:hypothetical protein [Planctomycetia bacterium]
MTENEPFSSGHPYGVGASRNGDYKNLPRHGFANLSVKKGVLYRISAYASWGALQRQTVNLTGQT